MNDIPKVFLTLSLEDFITVQSMIHPMADQFLHLECEVIYRHDFKVALSATNNTIDM